MSSRTQAEAQMLSTGRSMFGIGTIGILGCLTFIMCTKYIFGPALKKKRLTESCEIAESLIQLESEQKQKAKEEFEN